MAVISGDTLQGVSATTLWTLHSRATEAKRSDGAIRDPWAITLYDTIDYDYLKFGKANQSHALRAVAFDDVTRGYLTNTRRRRSSPSPRACRPACGGWTRLVSPTN
jgi:O-methyltransferase involved in polyketide biosynthesis